MAVRAAVGVGDGELDGVGTRARVGVIEGAWVGGIGAVHGAVVIEVPCPGGDGSACGRGRAVGERDG